MTIHARGYRPYEGALDAKGPRWVPITTQGYQDVVRGPGFKVLFAFILVLTVVLAFLVYIEAPGLTESFLFREPGHGQAIEIGMDSFVNRDPLRNLEGALLLFDFWSTLLVMLIVLFAASGLVSEDLKARALPLYLVRPITPFDYYFGKLLVPVRVLARAVLLPMLSLVLLAVLLRPSEEMWPFVWKALPLVGAVLLYYLVLAVGFSSLVLMFSALTSRKITAIVLGGVTFLGGIMVRGVVSHVQGDGAQVVRSLSISGDAASVLWWLVGRKGHLTLAPPSMAIGAVVVVTLLSAVVVLKRARSVEVVA